MIPSMHAYEFGNRTITCPFPLPSLRTTPAVLDASLRITAPTVIEQLTEREEWSQQWPDKHGNVLIQVALERPGNDHDDGNRTYLLKFSGMCEFRLDIVRGSIGIARLPATSAEAIEHLLIDHVLPCLLDGLGELVVHASCIGLDSGCVLFLGQSGWGKSTLTGLLGRHGHAPLSDDCTLLTLNEGVVQATPTYPGLRLFDDSIEQAFERIPRLHPVAEYTSKRRIRLDAQATHSKIPAPVRAAYLLNDPAQPATATSIDPVSSATACMTLIKHSFRLDLHARQRTAALMQQAAMAARRLPVFALRYPRDFAQAQQLITVLTRHFATLPTTGGSAAPSLSSPLAPVPGDLG